MDLSYSFIIPVYNRPGEIRELLESMVLLDFDSSFEIVIIEDGSSLSAKGVVEEFSDRLNISYLEKPNTGPGDSRNYGMSRANGNYFLILDSDVLLPTHYLKSVDAALKKEFIHCFGGPDAAHGGFSKVQKAINYSMTSFLTTGGIRGGEKRVGEFQPRSFNMGISEEAFENSGGFGRIHPGEDPDLALRLREQGYETRLIREAFVYHKRRIDWSKFYQQVYKFGMVRPVLNEWHSGTGKITYWFPAFFCFGLFLSIVLLFLGQLHLLSLYIFYLLVLLVHAVITTRSIPVGIYALWATLVQFFGYGFGFCLSTYYIRILKKHPEKVFPELFFRNAKAN